MFVHISAPTPLSLHSSRQQVLWSVDGESRRSIRGFPAFFNKSPRPERGLRWGEGEGSLERQGGERHFFPHTKKGFWKLGMCRARLVGCWIQSLAWPPGSHILSDYLNFSKPKNETIMMPDTCSGNIMALDPRFWIVCACFGLTCTPHPNSYVEA